MSQKIQSSRNEFSTKCQLSDFNFSRSQNDDKVKKWKIYCSVYVTQHDKKQWSAESAVLELRCGWKLLRNGNLFQENCSWCFYWVIKCDWTAQLKALKYFCSFRFKKLMTLIKKINNRKKLIRKIQKSCCKNDGNFMFKHALLFDMLEVVFKCWEA